MPQECERHQQVDQEGAAGDGGGEEQGGGQASLEGKGTSRNILITLAL